MPRLPAGKIRGPIAATTSIGCPWMLGGEPQPSAHEMRLEHAALRGHVAVPVTLACVLGRSHMWDGHGSRAVGGRRKGADSQNDNLLQ